MTGVHDLGLFIAAGLLLNVTPGPDMAYIAARGAAGGFRAGVAATLGITAGCIVHTLAAAAGLSVLLATSAAAFGVVKWCGAAYLLYAGLRLVAASARPSRGGNASAGRCAAAARADDADLPRSAGDQRAQPQGRAVLPRVPASIHRDGCAVQGAGVHRARLSLQLQQPVRQPAGGLARGARRSERSCARDHGALADRSGRCAVRAARRASRDARTK